MTISALYRCHRFPREIIAHAVWLHAHFPLSLRMVEELPLERGIDVSYETVRRWGAKFGPALARDLRRRAPRPGDIWQLDEVRVVIQAGFTGCGVRSTSTESSWTRSCSAGATRRRRDACSCGC